MEKEEDDVELFQLPLVQNLDLPVYVNPHTLRRQASLTVKGHQCMRPFVEG